MFCKNCGKELKDSPKFCPECGYRQEEEPKEEIKITAKPQKRETKSTERKRKKIPPWIAPLCLIVLLVIGIAGWLGNGKKEEKINEAVEQWFQESIEEQENEYTERCFEELGSSLSETLLSLDSEDSKSSMIENYIMPALSNYVFDDGIQERVVRAITRNSSYQVGDIQKVQGEYIVEVTVTSPDLDAINEAMLRDYLDRMKDGDSSQIADDIYQLTSDGAGVLAEVLADYAGREEFSQSYTGMLTLVYVEGEKSYWVSEPDENLIKAYFAVEE